MEEEKQPSRRRFLRRMVFGGATALAGLGAYRLLRTPSGPRYPEGLAGAVRRLAGSSGRPPNIVLINADDLGYGDLSCYGSTAIETPNIDRLAEEGMRFTDFHACDAVCTPSRAGLLTGRYPARMGLDTPLQALGEPLSKRAMVRIGYLLGRAGILDLAARGGGRGLPPQEITLAEALRSGGYRTGMVGKWHLGDYSADPAYNPLRHGFDFHFGVPYSNDMEPLPLYRDEEVMEPEVTDQSVLTGLYTREAEQFISSGGESPFFLYFAHTFPHRPLAASASFRGRSRAGLYGDAVTELDWSVGRILTLLRERRIEGDTVVFFTSDNGPWYQGSPGSLRGRKGQTFEGGHRVPFLARWPGRIVAGQVTGALASQLDLFPTCLQIAGLGLPEDRIVDGLDLTPLLTGQATGSPHEYLYLYHQGELEGVRRGPWKYLRATNHYTWPMPVNKKLGRLTNHTTGPTPLLYNLSLDPTESYNLVDRHPEVARELEGAIIEWENRMAADPLGLLPPPPL